jgi:hypothetical protein
MEMHDMSNTFLISATVLLALAAATASASHPLAAPGVTSLTNAHVQFQVTDKPCVVLERGAVRTVVVGNAAVDTPELPGHREGYNGLAILEHQRRKENLFVPSVAGLNFEHIHDGTRAGLKETFEPRKFPTQLRVVDRYTVEVYQPPTGNWKLESCGRYHLLEDGTVEYTFECIPRDGGYRHGYIGLFWASYIHQPEQGGIRFKGHARDETGPAHWIEATSPQHGIESTHAPAGFPKLPSVDSDFALTLVNHPSKHVYAEPWYFGVSHGMVYVLMFRQRDRIWMAQSPSGGGKGNPAWDFQWFIPDYHVGDAYGFVMRAAYLPYENREQVEQDTLRHREALNP